MIPHVPITNISSVPQQILGKWLTPSEVGLFPIKDIQGLRESKNLSFDWQASEGDYEKSFIDGKIQGLTFATPLSMYDGYGLIGVNTVKEFLRRNIDIDLYTLGWYIEQGLDPIVVNQLKKEKTYYNIAIAKGPPPDVIKLVPGGTIVNYSMWESTRIPSTWVPILNKLPLVIVPTKSQVEMYQDSGVTTPIKYFPDPIDTDYWSDRITTPNDGPFTIISWSRMSSRKMPLEMIQVFSMAFPLSQYPDIRFILKTNSGEFGAGKNLIPTVADPRITIINNTLTLDELKAWVGKAHLAFFLSRGEGMFNPPMQAMALGVPTVVVNHSGCSDYADERYNWPIQLDPITPFVPSPMVTTEDLMWWNPDINHAVYQLKAAYANYDLSLAKAKKAKVMVKKRYNTPLFVDNLIKALKEL